jgi:3-oxoacyl-[acyl-carrier-protein] synthase II
VTRRVVITGLGSVCPVGNDLPTTWDALIAGKSGVDYITHFDPAPFKVNVHAEVKDFDPTTLLEPKPLKHMDRNVQFACVSALEAMLDAGLCVSDANRDRIGVIYGSGGGGMSTLLHWHEVLQQKGPRRISPFFMSNFIADAASGHIAIQTGVTGPNYSPTSACATGVNAIGDGSMQIKAGKADAMIVGGSEAVEQPLFHACFESMRVLALPADPPSATVKPFDLNRTGFVPGEGAATLVIEELEHARARGAHIYAEVAGTGSGNDGFDMAAPDPSARGLLNAMRQALDEGCLPYSEVGYVNTHGSATQVGDKVDVGAVKRIFGEHASAVLVSSIKAATGHMMAASGALEAIVAALSLDRGIIPPTLNHETSDPALDLDCIPNAAREVDLEASMSISVGLGGHNAAVLFKRWRD